MSGFVGFASPGWLDFLQDASWRGLRFAVLESEVRRGRRTAEHQYPNRDIVWVEDLGKAARRYAFTGFVLGDDCYLQAQALGDAADVAGPGELVHPSLGSRQVTLVEFVARERADTGRVVELQFAFVEAAQPVYPQTAVDTQGAVSNAAGAADTAASGDFATEAAAAVASGIDMAQSAIGAAVGFVSRVESAVGDASLLAHAVTGLITTVTGTSFGRYAFGTRTVPLGGAITTVDQALAAATTARAAVSSAAALVGSVAAAL